MTLSIDVPPVSHLTRWDTLLFDGPLAINKTVLIYLIAVVLTLVFFVAAARKQALVPRGVQNMAEASIDFIRESVILQTIGPEGMVYLPFLTTMFFFILFINIFEVIPLVQFPGNARMAVPFLLALLVWVIFNFVGIAKQGFVGYVKNSLIPPGVPKFLLPLVALIEFVSTFFVRPFSQAVRLFANMLAGHLILVTFAVLTSAMLGGAVFLKAGFVLPLALLIALTAFEVLVSLLQAFIFTILTAVYIGTSLHPEH